MESEAMLAVLATLWRRLGHPPLIREWQAWPERPVHWRTFRECFGSWSQAVLLAWDPSLGPYGGRRRESSAALTELLTRDPTTLDPTQQRIRTLRSQGLSVKAIAVALGCSERSVMRYARQGAPPHHGKQAHWTPEMIVRAMRRAYARHGDAVLSVGGWRSHVASPSPNTIQRMFGTWLDAWDEAVPGTHPQSFEGIVRRLREAEAIHGPRVRRQGVWIRLGCRPSVATVRRYWGSWDAGWAAVDAARLAAVS